MRFLLFTALLLPGSEPAADQAREDIGKLLAAQAVAWNKGDLEGYMAGYWKSEELSFYGGKDKTAGWKQTLERYRKKYQTGDAEMGALTFSEIEINVLAADSAMARGRWKLTFKGKEEGKEAEGLFTLILRKKPEGWRIVHDHSSG